MIALTAAKQMKGKAVPGTGAFIFLAARDKNRVQSQLFCLALAKVG